MASGAIFAAGSSAWMNVLMQWDPFTYGVAGVRRGLFPGTDLGAIPELSTCLWVLLAMGAVFYAFSSWAVEKSKGAV
jgi:ABC-type polysaccharide/polyol phosphate export permease